MSQLRSELVRELEKTLRELDRIELAMKSSSDLNEDAEYVALLREIILEQTGGLVRREDPCSTADTSR
jgi:hypothetical protein